MRCAVCGEAVQVNGALGYVHQGDGTLIGEDGHTVLPVTARGEDR